MEIERLDPADFERFREIRLRSLRQAPEAFGSTYEETAARPAESWPQQLEDLTTFVAVVHGTDVGVARGIEFKGMKHTAILLSMWVAPEARGQGIGEALIDAVAGWARASGFWYLVLEVAKDNTPALTLYSRTGFELTDEGPALEDECEHRLRLAL